MSFSFVSFNVGEVIPGLKGIVGSCPQDIDDTPELSYSIFFKGKFSYSLQGPLSFVNYACVQIVGIRNQRVNLVWRWLK